jgi:hypothetical protein
MTQQYLAGELSLILAQLGVVATSPASRSAAAQLRELAETTPVAALSAVVVRALELIDSLCWESLQRGDASAFARQSALGAELRDFGVCASLIAEG